MTAEYSYTPDKKSVTRNLRTYLLYVYAPRFLRDLSLAAIFAAALPAWNAVHLEHPMFFPFACAALISLLIPFVTYFSYIGNVLKAIETTGSLDKELSVRLSDHEITVSYDKNTGTTEYRRLKYFFCRGDRLFLLADQNLPAGTILLDRIPGHEAEFIDCLRADGLKELGFWSFRRWWLNLFIAVLMAAGLVVGSYLINYANTAEPEEVSEYRENGDGNI